MSKYIYVCVSKVYYGEYEGRVAFDDILSVHHTAKDAMDSLGYMQYNGLDFCVVEMEFGNGKDVTVFSGNALYELHYSPTTE